MTIEDDYNQNVLVLKQLCVTKTAPKVCVFISSDTVSMEELAMSYLRELGYGGSIITITDALDNYTDETGYILKCQNCTIDLSKVPQSSKIVTITDDYRDKNRYIYMSFTFYSSSKYPIDFKFVEIFENIQDCDMDGLIGNISEFSDADELGIGLLSTCIRLRVNQIVDNLNPDIPVDRYITMLSNMPVQNFINSVMSNG